MGPDAIKGEGAEPQQDAAAQATAVPDVFEAIRRAVGQQHDEVPIGVLEGRVTGLSGLSISLSGLRDFTGVGDRVRVLGLDGRETEAEIVAFQGDIAIAMPFGSLEGIGSGCRASFKMFGPEERRRRAGGTLLVNESWKGRVLDPMGRPMDGKGPLTPA